MSFTTVTTPFAVLVSRFVEIQFQPTLFIRLLKSLDRLLVAHAGRCADKIHPTGIPNPRGTPRNVRAKSLSRPSTNF